MSEYTLRSIITGHLNLLGAPREIYVWGDHYDTLQDAVEACLKQAESLDPDNENTAYQVEQFQQFITRYILINNITSLTPTQDE